MSTLGLSQLLELFLPITFWISWNIDYNKNSWCNRNDGEKFKLIAWKLQKKNDMSYVIQGNGIRRKSDELHNDLGKLEKEVLTLKEKKRNLMHV